MSENIEEPTAVFREIPGVGGYFIDWSEESAKFLRKHKFEEINVKGSFSDLTVLAEYAYFLKRLVVTNEKGFYSGIESLINLDELYVNGKAKNPVAFEKFENLQKCSTKWHRHYAKSLLSLPYLNNLCISSYGEKDFSALSQSKSITEVRIIRSSVESFHGIGAMSELTKLWMQLTTKLKTFEGIQGATELKVLRVEDAKKVESCESIGQLRAIEALTLTNTGSLENLDFLYSMPSLITLWLPGAFPAHVNWPRLIAMPALENAWILCAKENMPSEKQIRGYAANSNKNIVHLEWQGTKDTPRLKLKMTIGG